jgi:hypothetical protein
MTTLLFSIVPALLFIAALFSVAIIRDRRIYLTRAKMSARIMIAGGLIGLGLRFASYIYDHGRLDVPVFVLIFHGCVALGLILNDLYRFAPFHWMDTRPGDLDDELPRDRRQVSERRHDRRASSVHTHDEGIGP